MSNFNRKDAGLKVTRALPAAASATVNSSGIDLGHGSRGAPLFDGELLLTYPAVDATMAPDTRTFTYKLQMDDNADFSSATDIAPSFVVQTGAGGAGAAGGTKRWRPPTNCERYVRLVCTSGASTADASAVSATLELVT